MTGPSRTKLEADANRLDLNIFRVVAELERFAENHRITDAREMAITIRGLRYRIRKHMHAKDREVTS